MAIIPAFTGFLFVFSPKPGIIWERDLLPHTFRQEVVSDGQRITYQDLKDNPEIRTYIQRADQSLVALGYTEHSLAHVTNALSKPVPCCSSWAMTSARPSWPRSPVSYTISVMVINRVDHAQSGAVMAFRLLDKLGMPAEEVATVISAIGNHDESTAFPVNAVAAALILADKSDVRRTRVRNRDFATFDIHDRVNYAVEESSLQLDQKQRTITLQLKIDPTISSVMDYFEIFLNRMILCRRAGDFFGLQFKLVINGANLL